MHVKFSGGVLVLVASFGLVAAVAGPAPAAPQAVQESSQQSGPSDVLPAPVAVGLIVHTDKASPSANVVAGIARAASADVDDVTPIDQGLVTVPFAEPVSGPAAVEAAAEMTEQPGVDQAEPNYLLTRSAASPVPLNDPYFTKGSMRSLWDQRAAAAGGFSIRVPYLWRATRGSAAVRVAVIDSGFTSHGDLNANRVAGYDFVSATDGEGDPSNRDHDLGPTGNGWDPNAADPGDWATTGQCSDGAGGFDAPSDSSWHGTHVAGTIAAVDNNKAGVVGVSPDVRFQPIRVMGPCGGSTADIATAIRWAAGESIPGVPANPTPVRVINLSLGEPVPCGGALQEAVTAARGRGVVVVAAAGNNAAPDLFAPASCEGVVAVVASTEVGQLTSYSNVGSDGRPADIAAPGGSASYQRITSTYNDGRTVPGSATYASRTGTSMATAHVSGAAALLASLGYSGPEIEQGLRSAARPFPAYGNAFDCTAVRCGAGLLDLARVPAVFGARSITGTMKRGKTLSTPMRGTGVAARYQWYRNGRAIPGATSTSYRVKKADRKKTITVRATVVRAGFKTVTAVSAGRRVK